MDIFWTSRLPHNSMMPPCSIMWSIPGLTTSLFTLPFTRLLITPTWSPLQYVVTYNTQNCSLWLLEVLLSLNESLLVPLLSNLFVGLYCFDLISFSFHLFQICRANTSLFSAQLSVVSWLWLWPCPFDLLGLYLAILYSANHDIRGALINIWSLIVTLLQHRHNFLMLYTPNKWNT